jgi:hypothetical protein
MWGNILTHIGVHHTYWDMIKSKKRFGNPMGAVKKSNNQPWFTNWEIPSLEDSLPEMYCTDLAEAYAKEGMKKLKAYVNKMVRALAKT